MCFLLILCVKSEKVKCKKLFCSLTGGSIKPRYWGHALCVHVGWLVGLGGKKAKAVITEMCKPGCDQCGNTLDNTIHMRA